MKKARKISALIVAVLKSTVSIYYSWLIWRGAIEPVLATWLLICAAVTLSFWTYWSTKQHSLISNVGNSIDVANVWLILLSLLFLGQNIRMGFNCFEIGCLAASAALLAAWRISKQHALANLACQVMLTVAYLPTLLHLWQSPRNTESFTAWIVLWVAGIASFVPAVIDRDKLAFLYAARGTTLVTAILALMLRIELR